MKKATHNSFLLKASLCVMTIFMHNIASSQETTEKLPLMPGTFRIPYIEYVSGDSVVYLENDSIYFPISSRKVTEQIAGKEVYIMIKHDSPHRETDRLVRSQTDYFSSSKGDKGIFYRKYRIVSYRMLFDKNHGKTYMQWPSGHMKTARHEELCMVDDNGDTLRGYFLLYTKESLDRYEELHRKSASEMGYYEISLVKVEKPTGKNIGKSTLSANGIYEDNVISIKWSEDRQIFNFNLKNLTAGMMKVVWDEALIVNFEGFTERVIHKGTDLDALKQSQLPSLIPSKAQLADFFWSERYYGGNRLVYGYGGTKYKEENNGKRMSLILPVLVGNVSYVYTFIFEMNWKWSHPELREQ